MEVQESSVDTPHIEGDPTSADSTSEFKKPSYGLMKLKQEPSMENEKEDKVSIEEKKDLTFQPKYLEPFWSTKPIVQWSIEVLKNGTLIDTIDISSKGCFLIGRVPNCDIVLDHQSISRQHAVLQHKGDGTLYVYDLGSTHGTFVNKKQIRANAYQKIQTGDLIRFGESSRLYVVQGPKVEEEFEQSIQGNSQSTELNLQKTKQSLENKKELQREIPKEEKEEEEQVFSGNLQEMREWKKGKTGQKDSKKKRKQKQTTDKLTLKEQELESQLNPKKDEEEEDFFAKDLDEEKEEEEMPKIDMESFYRGVESGEEYISSDEDVFFDRTSQAKKRRLKQKQVTTKEIETYSTLLSKKEEFSAQRDAGLREIARLARENYDISAQLQSAEIDPLQAYMLENTLKLNTTKGKEEKEKVANINEQILQIENLIKKSASALPKFEGISLNKHKKEQESPSLAPVAIESATKTISNLKQKEQETTKDDILPEQRDNSKKKKKKKKVKEKFDDEYDYSEWVPPSDQTGDGKTFLNRQFGY